MNKPKKFLIIGRTASGKSSIVKAVAEKLGLTVVKSYTTRKQRNDKDTDHIFISKDDVGQYRNQMVAYTEINGYEYFVTYDMLDKSDLYVIDPNGVGYLKTHCKDFEYIEIYIRVPEHVSKERAKHRGDKLQVYKDRYDSENEQFRAYEKGHTFHYHLLNTDTFDVAVDKVSKWVQKELENI